MIFVHNKSKSCQKCLGFLFLLINFFLRISFYCLTNSNDCLNQLQHKRKEKRNNFVPCFSDPESEIGIGGQMGSDFEVVDECEEET